MQLSPSTLSDPNDFALLFATAAPTAAVAPTGAPAAPPGEVNFEALFGPLTSHPGAASQENSASPGAESLLASPPTLFPARGPEHATNAGNAEASAAPLCSVFAANVDAPIKPETGEIAVPTVVASSAASEDEKPDGPTSGEPRVGQRPASKFPRCSAKPADAEAKAPANEFAPIIAPLAPDAVSLPVLSSAFETAEILPASSEPTGRDGAAEGRGDAVFDVLAKQSPAPAAFASPVPRTDRSIDIGDDGAPPAEHSYTATAAPQAPVASPDTQGTQRSQTGFHMPRPELAVRDGASFATEAPVPLADASAHSAPAESVSAEVSLDLPTLALEVNEPQPTFRPQVGAGQGTMTAANFAADRSVPIAAPRSAPEAIKKSFLTASPERFAQRGRTLGTDVANSDAAMSTRSSSASLPHPTFEYADVAAAPSTLAANSDLVPAVTSRGDRTQASELAVESDSLSSHTQEVSDAHRAVEVVLHAVDRVAERTRSAVKLEFSVGDADLIVRVELQDGEVHTTFRTDSADLRDALAQEWHAVVSAQGERGVRLAPAQFSSNDDRAQDGFTGHNPSQQHGRSPTQREAQPSFTPAFSRVAHPATHTAIPVSATAPSRALAPAGTAQRLHFFA